MPARKRFDFPLLILSAVSLVFTLLVPMGCKADGVPLNSRVIARMSKVDDVGKILVWNRSGLSEAFSCSWSSGAEGSGSVELGPSLAVGDNYVVFLLYNKIFKGLWGGKWSFAFTLEQDGRIVWSQARRVGDNSRGIKFSKIFLVRVASNGTVEVSEPSSPSGPVEAIEMKLREIEKLMNESLSPATPLPSLIGGPSPSI